MKRLIIWESIDTLEEQIALPHATPVHFPLEGKEPEKSSLQRFQDQARTEYVPGNKRPKKLSSKVDAVWKGILQDIEELEEIQKNEADKSGYMAGLYNGLAVAKSCLTGEEAQLAENPDKE